MKKECHQIKKIEKMIQTFYEFYKKADKGVYVGVKVGKDLYIYKNEGEWGVTVDGKSTCFPFVAQLQVDFNHLTDQPYYVIVNKDTKTQWEYMSPTFLSIERLNIFNLILDLTKNLNDIKFYAEDSI